MGSNSWIVRLSAAADEDYRQVLRWTASNFGKAQARSYAHVVMSALKELSSGPSIVGAKERGDTDLHQRGGGRRIECEHVCSRTGPEAAYPGGVDT